MKMEVNSDSNYHIIATDNVEFSIHKSRKQWVTVEPVVFLLFVSQTLTGAVLTNLYLVHTCEVELGFNHSDCAQLGSRNMSEYTRELESKVQPHTTVILMSKSILEACLPALLSFFLGPWSDINGRKPLLMWPMLGYSMTYLLYLGASLVPSLPPKLLLLASLPVALSGGFIAVISAMYSYISDVSPPEKLSLRMSVLEAALFMGLLVGTAACSHLYAVAGNMGYVAVFGSSGSLCLLGFLYCVLLLPESVNTQTKHPYCCLGSGLFQWHYVRDVVQTVCRTRPNYGRAMTFMIMIALATCIITMEGESAVSYLFVREKFGWNLQDYTTFGCITILTTTVGMLLGTSLLSTWLKVPDAPLTAFGYFTRIFASVLAALSTSSWFLYVASVVGMFGGLVGPLSHSMLPKIVPQEDIGKVFSLTASIEALTPLASSTIYTLVYNCTLVTFPGAFYLLTAGILAFDFLLLLTVVIIQHIIRTTPECDELSSSE